MTNSAEKVAQYIALCEQEREAATQEMAENTKKFIQHLSGLTKALNLGREYIPDPSYAPPGVTVEQGPKGGYYYEGQKPDVASSGFGPKSHFELDFQQVAARQMSTEEFYNANKEALQDIHSHGQLYDVFSNILGGKNQKNLKLLTPIIDDISYWCELDNPEDNKYKTKDDLNVDMDLFTTDLNMFLQGKMGARMSMADIYHQHRKIIDSMIKQRMLTEGLNEAIVDNNPAYKKTLVDRVSRGLTIAAHQQQVEDEYTQNREKEKAQAQKRTIDNDRYRKEFGVPEGMAFTSVTSDNDVIRIMEAVKRLPPLKGGLFWNVKDRISYKNELGKTSNPSKLANSLGYCQHWDGFSNIHLMDADSIYDKVRGYVEGGFKPFNTGELGNSVDRSFQFIVAHEYSHALDADRGFGSIKPSNSEKWKKLVYDKGYEPDGFPSRYANTNAEEAFAESCALMSVRPNQMKERYPLTYATLAEILDWHPAEEGKLDMSLQDFGIIPFVSGHLEDGTSYIGLPEEVTRDQLGNVIKVPNESENGIIGKSGIVKGERSINGLSSYWLLENGQMIKSVVAYDDDEADEILKG